ncbi:MAG: GNAT family N-acetyltransferase, partial [Dehalococcoidia bacterium]
MAEADGRLVAVGGLEIRDDTAVLRSVAVDDSMRGTGVGRGLARELIDLAARASVADIYLFTG